MNSRIGGALPLTLKAPTEPEVVPRSGKTTLVQSQQRLKQRDQNLPPIRIATPQPAAPTELTSANLERVLRDFPLFARSVGGLLNAVESAAQGQPALTQPVEAVRQALAKGQFESAATQLVSLTQSLTGGNNEPTRLARAGLALQSRLLNATAGGLGVPTPAVLQRGDALLASYAEQSQALLDSQTASGFVEFADDAPGTDLRLRPNDAAKALLRLNTALWSVNRDLRAGTLTPRDFGKGDWNQVDGKALSALATKRLENGTLDLAAESAGLLHDPTWGKHPVYFTDTKTGQRAPLSADNAGNFWKESILSAVVPDQAAQRVNGFDFAQQMMGNAVTVADADPRDRHLTATTAQITMAHSLFKGGQLAPNATTALATCAKVAGISLVDLAAAPSGSTRESLQAQKHAGAILDFAEKDGHLFVAREKHPRQVASEVFGKLNTRPLADLDLGTRAKLEEMMGPRKNPGATLEQRTQDESSQRKWRQLSGEVAKTALIGVASMGVGAFAESVAYGADAGLGAVTSARVVAQSAAYTVASHAGDLLHATDFLKDLGMMGVLRVGGQFAGLAQKLVPGSSATAGLARQALGQATAIGTSSALVTGFSALEQTAKGGSWAQKFKDDFGHNLLVTTTLHGINLGLARLAPALAENAPARADFEALRAKVEQANQGVQKTLDASADLMARANPAPKAEREALAGQQEALMRQLDGQRAEVDALRTSLLAFAQKRFPEQAADVVAAFGSAMPKAAMGELNDASRALQATVVERFVDVKRAYGIDQKGQPQVLEKGVKGVSAGVVSSFLDVVKSPFASLGTDNIKHLGSVFQDALRQSAHDKGAPLTQKEVDRLAQETVLTDVWYKGHQPAALSKAPTAPTNAGSTGGEIYEHLKATAKANVFEGTNVEPVVKDVISQWIDRGFIPMNKAEVATELTSRAQAAAKEKGLGEAQTNTFVDKVVSQGSKVWGERIMGSGEWANVQGFMLGTWLHGIPSFDLVQQAVHAAPHAGASPQEVYEAVLGHHMAGFVAAGFGRGRLGVDFAQMEASGQLPKGAGDRLSSLYDSSSALANAWRARIDRGLTNQERAEYWADAAPMRDAIANLTPQVRRQLLSDDSGQFTPYEAMGKWVGMNGSAANMQAAIAGVTRAAQAYSEESRARDGNANPAQRGAEFLQATAPTLEKLGVTMDAQTGVFRPAEPGERAHQTLAQGITHDPALKEGFAKAHPGATLGSPLSSADAIQLVDWFRALPVDVAAATRLSSAR